jgi:hypothetical protein
MSHCRSHNAIVYIIGNHYRVQGFIFDTHRKYISALAIATSR